MKKTALLLTLVMACALATPAFAKTHHKKHHKKHHAAAKHTKSAPQAAAPAGETH